MSYCHYCVRLALRGSVSRHCERLQGAWQSRKNNKNAMHFTRLLRQNL
ncbi:hypothetical protein RBEAN4_1583 [Rickettsia bellii str. RML An4]|uniref:Uncharacterized protein n=1 Tax=Rickettsia bellii str. RML An4 TaxID=1359193 RepID=A0A0F3QDD1_RICBE|nr:hypothetical protein RBEAN4_1583 [Rickettsia bellii str. RML An4]